MMATPRNVSAFKMFGEAVNCAIPLRGNVRNVISRPVQRIDFKMIPRFAPNAMAANEPGLLKNTQMPAYTLPRQRKTLGEF